MRVLIVSQMQRFVTASGPSKAAASNLLQHLCARHDLHLAIVTDTAARVPVEWAQSSCRSLTLLSSARGTRPGRLASVAGRRSRELQEQFRRFVEKLRPDIVHLDGLAMAPLVSQVPTGTATIISIHEMPSIRYRELASFARTPTARISCRINALLTRLAEERWLPIPDRVVVASQHDADALLRTCHPKSLDVIPQAVDLDYYAYRPQPVPGRVVFCGDLSWPPNADAAEYLAHEVMPLLRRRVPHAELCLLGTEPCARVRALAGLPAIRVEATGAAADLRQWISSAAVYVAPLRFGSGLGNRLPEAMALGAAIVATPRGISSTAPGDDGRHLLVADSPAGLAGAAAAIMNDDNLRCALSRKARRQAEAAYSGSSVAARFDELYRYTSSTECRVAS